MLPVGDSVMAEERKRRRVENQGRKEGRETVAESKRCAAV
jgi:hypothetical protein